MRRVLGLAFVSFDCQIVDEFQAFRLRQLFSGKRENSRNDVASLPLIDERLSQHAALASRGDGGRCEPQTDTFEACGLLARFAMNGKCPTELVFVARLARWLTSANGLIHHTATKQIGTVPERRRRFAIGARHRYVSWFNVGGICGVAPFY